MAKFTKQVGFIGNSLVIKVDKEMKALYSIEKNDIITFEITEIHKTLEKIEEISEETENKEEQQTKE